MIRTGAPDPQVTLIEIDRHERRNALDVAHVDDPELDVAFLACWGSEDVREARRAGTDRRPAVFHGR